MKVLPLTAILACSVLLFACNRPQTNNPDIDKQVQERLDEEHQAQAQRELHEREAALDERERVLAQKEQQLSQPTPAPSAPAILSAPPIVQQPPSPPAPSAPPALDTTYQAFFDGLAPYGTWIDLAGYGYVWQPAAAVQDILWRPYTLGHWLFTNAGWTWASGEPFGWITYHYGRWMRTHNLNWVWVPGDLWAPAWVSWRCGNDFVGWAPLPPEARFDPSVGIQQWTDQQYSLSAADYTFIPAADFGDENMAGDTLPPGEDGGMYDASNNVTNIYYDSGAIVCYGPGYDFFRSKARHPFPPPLILSRNGYRTDGNNSAVISGNTLQVTAPRISRTRNPEAPKNLRPRVVDTRIVSSSTPASVSPPNGMRIPSQMRPVPISPEIDSQKARDIQVIQQQQTAQPAAKEHHAEGSRTEETTHAPREQLVHQTQPVIAPAGSPGQIRP